MIKQTKLKNYFPMLRTREEIINEIKGNEKLLAIYHTWKDYEKEEFLNFCTGAKGVKMYMILSLKKYLILNWHRNG